MKKITIHNLDTSTAQEVFDFIANHLLTQNAKSESITYSSNDSDPIVTCFYRKRVKNKILKCAAGCLIPKKDYKPEFEDNPWRNVNGDGIVKNYKLSKSHSELIDILQSLHDNKNVIDWKPSLIIVASTYKLNWNFK